MTIDKASRDLLLQIFNDKKVRLEGNILKLIEADPEDQEFQNYIKESTEKDKDQRKRRLDITKQIQQQNTELLKWKKENQELTDNLKEALKTTDDSRKEAVTAKEEAEKAKDIALNDLDIIQKKTQTELISTIVKVALYVIIGVGATTTIMYCIALLAGKDTQIIGSTWSNMFGILLTNAFSIVGTIMGVKYASENTKKS
jgi:Fe2+ transport system protein B